MGKTTPAYLPEFCRQIIELVREARRAAFGFIEGFYNPRRRLSSIGYFSPIDYARRHHAAAVVPDAHQPAAVLAAVKDKPIGRPQTRPSLTAAPRGSHVSARVGTSGNRGSGRCW